MPTSVQQRRCPLAAAVILALGATSAQAATITVTNGGDTADMSSCTLRQAIVTMTNGDAVGSNEGTCRTSAVTTPNGFGTNDTIVFDTSAVPSDSTVTLSLGELAVSSLTAPLTIQGSGQTIDANHASRVLHVFASELTLSSLTLSGGYLARYTGDGSGAYIHGGGTLTLSNSTVSGNYAGGGGGCVSVDAAMLKLYDSTCSGNSTYFAAGGIEALEFSSVTLVRSDVSNNSTVRYSGGGMSIYKATLSMTNSTVAGNSGAFGSAGCGGGVYVNNATSVLVNSTISGNHADFNGGGVCVMGGTLTLEDCAVSANSTNTHGGGIDDEGASTVALVNSTISGNYSQYDGGGLYVAGGTLTIGNSTVSANSSYMRGGGVVAMNVSTATLANTILAGNSAGMGSPDLYSNSSTLNATYSVLGGAFDAPPYNDLANHNIFADDPGLVPLADNGGPTKTMALAVDSKALNVGAVVLATNPATGYALSFDQRGWGYPRTLSGLVDAGAYQHQPTDRIFVALFESGP